MTGSDTFLQPAWSILEGDTNTADAVRSDPGAFLGSGDAASLLSALAVTTNADAVTALLKATRAEDADEIFAAQLDEPGAREIAAAAVFVHAPALLRAGRLGVLAFAEVDALDDRDPADVAIVARALRHLRSDSLLPGLGVADGCVVRATAGDTGLGAMLENQWRLMGRAIADTRAVPSPADLYLPLVLSALDSERGDDVLAALSEASALSAGSVAALIAQTCGAVAAAGSEHTDDGPVWERADAAVVRGCLEAAQVALSDLSPDSFAATFTYEDEFEQPARADMFVGITARRVAFRVLLSGAIDPAAALATNYAAGLARLATDRDGRLVAVVEVPREGFAPDVLDAVLDDLRRLIQSL